MSVADALRSLRPKAIWSLNGVTYAGLEWLDKVQTKPSEQEINDEIERLQTVKDAEAIRQAAIKADASRAEMLNALRVSSLSEIEAFIRGKINADGVTTNAQAIACLKRIETALVTFGKIIALDARR